MAKKKRPSARFVAKPALEEIDAAQTQLQDTRLARALASVDERTRNKAIASVAGWLSKQGKSTAADIERLWMALYFCFWHTDHNHVQERVAEQLAGLVHVLPQEVVMLYFSAFMLTMRREWSRTDRLRMDKYQMLLRVFVRSMLQWTVGRESWSRKRIGLLTDFFREHVLLPNDTLPAMGVSLHLADVYLPELLAVAAGQPPKAATWTRLLMPWYMVAATCTEKALLARVRSAVFEPLAEEYANPDPDSLALTFFDPQKVGTALHDLAGSRPNGYGRNRQLLYDLAAKFAKLQPGPDSSQQPPLRAKPARRAATASSELPEEAPPAKIGRKRSHADDEQNGQAAKKQATAQRAPSGNSALGQHAVDGTDVGSVSPHSGRQEHPDNPKIALTEDALARHNHPTGQGKVGAARAGEQASGDEADRMARMVAAAADALDALFEPQPTSVPAKLPDIPTELTASQPKQQQLLPTHTSPKPAVSLQAPKSRHHSPPDSKQAGGVAGGDLPDSLAKRLQPQEFGLDSGDMDEGTEAEDALLGQVFRQAAADDTSDDEVGPTLPPGHAARVNSSGAAAAKSMGEKRGKGPGGDKAARVKGAHSVTVGGQQHLQKLGMNGKVHGSNGTLPEAAKDNNNAGLHAVGASSQPPGTLKPPPSPAGAWAGSAPQQAESCRAQEAGGQGQVNGGGGGANGKAGRNGEAALKRPLRKAGKRLRFNLSNNIVWTPGTAMPAAEVRTPPRSQPRGSALKKVIQP